MKSIAAPIHLDALILPHDTVVKDALADYSRIPYTDKNQDYNPDTPYVGEAILNHPFQDKNLMLKAGVHLHWSFPKGYAKTIGIPMINKSDLDELKTYFPTRFTNTTTKWNNIKKRIWKDMLIDSGWIQLIDNKRASVFDRSEVIQDVLKRGKSNLYRQVGWTGPSGSRFMEALKKILNKPLGSEYVAVPDIWLVRRNSPNLGATTWIVESHYISKTRSAQEGNEGAVSVPFHDDRHDNKSQPFRFMGRQVTADNKWRSGNLKGKNYLQQITAVGYNPQPGTKGFAEPTFAAFYPNCMSVFGFFDPSITSPTAGLTYEVVGLFSNPDSDYLKIFLKDFDNRYDGSDHYFDRLNEALESEFHWKMAANTPIKNTAIIPANAVLYGKAVPRLPKVPSASQMDIAVGNTGTEALSAYLGDKISGDKKKIEELLESIQFSSKLQNKVLDVGHKFQEARHDKGFTAFPGGTLWSIKLESVDPQGASDHNDSHWQEPALPHSLAVLLNDTNILQTAYDKTSFEVPYLRRQLFSDWYKYMVSAYPPMDNMTFYYDQDELLQYIRREGIQSLEEKLKEVGPVSIVKDDQGRFKYASFSGNRKSIADELAAKLNLLNNAIFYANEAKGADGTSWKDKGKCLALRAAPAPRYWRANDPVILFAEKHRANRIQALSNDRHATPGSSAPDICQLFNSPLAKPNDFTFDEGIKLFDKVRDLFSKIMETGNSQSNTIWNPFMMEWEVEYLPAFPGSNEATEVRLYNNEYVNQHYTLPETDPDLSLTANSSIFKNPNLYTGSTILTPNADVRLDKAISVFVSQHGKNQTASVKSMLSKAQQVLKKTNVLSQSLGGFHEALLMQKQTRQLDIADPLGFREYQTFAEEVAPLVEKFNLTAPQPLGEFNPVRCGMMRILNLRLIDTFGQTVDFEYPNVVTAEPMKAADGTKKSIHLKPRLSQPAQLNFRFLSASSGEEEMNTHPATSPVCGWLLPNNLDRSIMFYDQDGGVLGALTMNASNPWMSAPDSATTTFIDSIGNLYLRRVARYLLDQQRNTIGADGSTDNSYLHHFLNALDNAQENIDPENFAEHQDLAVLMGKPIAVVRAKLQFQLEGPPAVDQSWTQLTQELQGHGRTSDDFTKVKFPIRLGEYKQLNDGLIGYWIERPDGKLEDMYYSSEADTDPTFGIRIKTYTGQPLNISRSLDDDPFCVTMLVNPLGSIHAVSGILPVKSISIPKDQYQQALRKIAITFLTAPVLSTENHLKISLPKEPGFEWTWLEKTEDRYWQEIPQSVLVNKSLFDSKFPDQPDLWDDLVTKKWLQPIEADPERALVTTAVHRAFPPNEEGDPHPFPIDIGKRLDAFFDTYGQRIEPFDFHVTFGGPQVIREGWLRLETAQATKTKEEV